MSEFHMRRRADDCAAKVQSRGYDQMQHLRAANVAEILAVSIKTLEGWRAKKIGPPVKRIGKRAVAYPVKGLQEWLDSLSK